MSRLIDADEAVDAINNRIRQIGYEDNVLALSIRQAVRDVKPVDVVPVVRCKDCKWWHDWNGECYAKEAQGFGHIWNADDYCSYRERKDGDNAEGSV